MFSPVRALHQINSMRRKKDRTGKSESSRPGARMVKEQIHKRGVRDKRVLDVLEQLDRRDFVAPELRAEAYEDRPLQTRHGQTISQPYIVGAMTEFLRLEPHHRVLEIGTGSGYQTAVLARLARHVTTVELYEDLAADARRALGELGIRNVQFVTGDGTKGYPEHAPYDRVLVTAAPPKLPAALLDQLQDPGVLVAPEGVLGDPLTYQTLRRWTKRDGAVEVENLFEVRFVPLRPQE